MLMCISYHSAPDVIARPLSGRVRTSTRASSNRVTNQFSTIGTYLGNSDRDSWIDLCIRHTKTLRIIYLSKLLSAFLFVFSLSHVLYHLKLDFVVKTPPSVTNTGPKRIMSYGSPELLPPSMGPTALFKAPSQLERGLFCTVVPSP
jgi:hypothetical protein